jgi:hypothetical protein
VYSGSLAVAASESPESKKTMDKKMRNLSGKTNLIFLTIYGSDNVFKTVSGVD